jgi:hypothetical protein
MVRPSDDDVVDVEGKGLPPRFFDMGGMSGGPVFAVLENNGIVRWLFHAMRGVAEVGGLPVAFGIVSHPRSGGRGGSVVDRIVSIGAKMADILTGTSDDATLPGSRGSPQ